MQLEMVAGGKGGCGETFLEIPKKAEGCVAAFLTGPGLRTQALSNESNITEAQQWQENNMYKAIGDIYGL